MNNGELKRIERLKQKLYSVGGAHNEPHRHTPSGAGSQVPDNWSTSVVDEKSPESGKKGKLFLLFSSLFLGGAVLYGVFFFFFMGGGNLISSSNIEIVVSGPISVKAGEKAVLDIGVKNNNGTELEFVDLVVEYPEGTRSAAEDSKELPRERQGLGAVGIDEEAHRAVSAAFFGSEGEEKIVKITVEYRVQGSNAVFYKEAEYVIAIGSAPLSLLAKVPEEASSGQQIAIPITITSNSTEVIKDVLITAEYPPGFNFASAEPQPLFADRVWKIGDLKPNGSRTVTVRGTLAGNDGDMKTFRFNAGIQSSKDEKAISGSLASVQEDVEMQKAFIGISIAVDGKSDPEPSVKSGRSIRVDISYTNNLKVPIEDAVITLSLSGSALDRASVSPERGTYQSSKNLVTWSSSTMRELESIPPGGKGVVSVSLSSLQSVSSIQKPEIVLKSAVSGRRIEEMFTSDVSGTSDRRVRIQSDVELVSRLLYHSGPFKNEGPLPPKAEQPTTYTVVWTISNSSNTLTDAEVKASLPSYAEFVGSVSPEGEKVSFSKVGGVITWDLGEVKAGSGFSQSAREVAFQIRFTPSITHVGAAPVIMNEGELTARDSFTGSAISITRNPLNTRLSSDPSAKQGDEIVAR